MGNKLKDSLSHMGLSGLRINELPNEPFIQKKKRNC